MTCSTRGKNDTLDVKSVVHSLCSVATTTYRKDFHGNQDYCAIAINEMLDLRAVIVADGLGTFEYAEFASKCVTQFIKTALESARSHHDLDFIEMFRDAKSELFLSAARFEQEKGVTVIREQSLATTLIVAVEDSDSIRVAYVGNGAIWHIRGNFNHFHSSKYLPWNAVNYLNPHSVQNAFGKEALYRSISLSDNFDESLPSILCIEKDSHSFGDIIMICTDGLYSLDQVPVGKLKDGSLWISGTPTMPPFFDCLAKYFETNKKPSSDSLAEAMQLYLDSLLCKQIIDDDATLGILITSKALLHQQTYQLRTRLQTNANNHHQ